MLRPGLLLAQSLTGTFVDTLLRTDLAIRKYPSYAGTWLLPRSDFHRLEDACLWARPNTTKSRVAAQRLTMRLSYYTDA